MSTIITRSGKGASLSWAEGDANFNNLNTDKAELTDLASNANGKGASLVGIEDAGGLVTATTVEGAIQEDVANLNAHLADTTDAHDASAISNIASGNISSTDVQSAINELDLERILRVANATALEAITPTSGFTVFVTSDDGGMFAGVTGAAPATYTNDGGSYCGTVRIPSGGDGSSAWVRKDVDNVNAVWFGATGDGTTDDTTALQLAAAYSTTSKKSLYIPAGTYKVTSTISIGGASTTGLIVYGDGPGATIIDCELSSTSAFLVYDCSIRDMKFTGRGRTSGFGETGISFYTSATVKDLEVFNVHFNGFDTAGIRLSSAYNGIIELGRTLNCGIGYLFDNTGTWSLGTTTWKLASVYVGLCDIGFKTQGSSNLIADLVTVEFCTTVADITGGRLHARRLYRESNTNGVTGTNVLGYIDENGSKVTSGDADSVTFFIGGDLNERGLKTMTGAPSHNINTARGNQLGITAYETATVLHHEYEAKGTEAGLRDKYPVASMNAFIELSGYVYANGTVYTKDNYGLTITKTGTGTYEITWNTATFNNQQARVPIVHLTANEGAESSPANPFILGYYNLVSTPGNFITNGLSTGIRVRTRQWNGTGWTDTDCAFSFNVKIRLGGNTGEIPNFNLFGRDTTA